MAKFNKSTAAPASGRSVLVTESTPSGRTYNGAPGYERNAKSELFLLAVSNMVGEQTYYEKADDRDNRFQQLIAAVAVEDPQWITEFLNWLRTSGNMRSASLVGALEAARAMVAANKPGSRRIVASVLQRADEPGEALAYWTSKYGRKLPKPIKRGIADGAEKLYTEYGLLKYDTASHAVRFADVLDLTHPDAKAPWQAELYRLALARRHNRDEEPGELLQMVRNQQGLRARLKDSAQAPTTEELQASGMTWEDTLSLLGGKVDKAALWEAQIPTMGYMALLRNLRNFDEAGISAGAAQQVINRLIDPAEVAKSRQFPYRFLAAYREAPDLRWGPALNTALNLSTANIPALPGRSLVLIDTSASMRSSLSANSKITAADAAALFGVVLAARAGADLYGFADGTFEHKLRKGASVIEEMQRFTRRTGEVGHGTEIAGAIRATFKQHDRVFIISDMQTTGRGTPTSVPASVPLYGFNLMGYRYGAMPSGQPGTNRHEFGGLTDATFRMIPLLEAGRDGNWPWEQVQ